MGRREEGKIEGLGGVDCRAGWLARWSVGAHVCTYACMYAHTAHTHGSDLVLTYECMYAYITHTTLTAT